MYKYLYKSAKNDYYNIKSNKCQTGGYIEYFSPLIDYVLHRLNYLGFIKLLEENKIDDKIQSFINATSLFRVEKKIKKKEVEQKDKNIEIENYKTKLISHSNKISKKLEKYFNFEMTDCDFLHLESILLSKLNDSDKEEYKLSNNIEELYDTTLFHNEEYNNEMIKIQKELKTHSDKSRGRKLKDYKNVPKRFTEYRKLIYQKTLFDKIDKIDKLSDTEKRDIIKFLLKDITHQQYILYYFSEGLKQIIYNDSHLVPYIFRIEYEEKKVLDTNNIIIYNNNGHTIFKVTKNKKFEYEYYRFNDFKLINEREEFKGDGKELIINFGNLKHCKYTIIDLYLYYEKLPDLLNIYNQISLLEENDHKDFIKPTIKFIDEIYNRSSKRFSNINPLIYSFLFLGKIDVLIKILDDTLQDKKTDEKKLFTYINIDNASLFTDPNKEIENHKYNLPKELIDDNLLYTKAYNYFSYFEKNNEISITKIGEKYSKVFFDFIKDIENFKKLALNCRNDLNKLYNDINQMNELIKIIIYSYVMFIIINKKNVNIWFNSYDIITNIITSDTSNNLQKHMNVISDWIYTRQIIEKVVIINDKEFNTCGESKFLDIVNYILLDDESTFIIPVNMNEEFKKFYTKYLSMDKMYDDQNTVITEWSILLSKIKDIDYIQENIEIIPTAHNICKLLLHIFGVSTELKDLVDLIVYISEKIENLIENIIIIDPDPEIYIMKLDRIIYEFSDKHLSGTKEGNLDVETEEKKNFNDLLNLINIPNNYLSVDINERNILLRYSILTDCKIDEILKSDKIIKTILSIENQNIFNNIFENYSYKINIDVIEKLFIIIDTTRYGDASEIYLLNNIDHWARRTDDNMELLINVHVNYIKGNKKYIILENFIMNHITNPDNIKFIQNNNVKYFIYLYSRLALNESILYIFDKYVIEFVSINHNIEFIIDLLGEGVYSMAHNFENLICEIIKSMGLKKKFDINNISIEEISDIIRESIKHKHGFPKRIFDEIFIKMNEDIFDMIYDSFIINGEIKNLLIFIMKIKKEEYFESNQTKLFELYVEYIKGRDIDLILDEFIIKQIINSDNIKFIQENNVKYFIYLYSRLRLKRDVFNDYFADNFDDYDIAIYRIANYLIEIVSINHNINFIIDLLDGTSMYDDSYHFRVLICTIIKTMIHNNNFDINKISIEEISYMIRKSIQNKTYKYIFNGIFIKMNEDIFNKIYDSFIINGDITNLLIFIMNINKEEYFKSNQNKLFELYVNYIKLGEKDIFLETFIIKNISESDNIRFIQKNNVKYFIYLYFRSNVVKLELYDYFIEVVSLKHNIEFIIDLFDEKSMDINSSSPFYKLISQIIKLMRKNKKFDINEITIEEISNMIRKSIKNKMCDFIFNEIFIEMNEDIFNKIYDSFIKNKEIKNLLIFIMKIKKEEYFKSNQNKLFELYVDYIKLGEKDIFLDNFIMKQIINSDNIKFIQKNNVKYFIYFYSRLYPDKYISNIFDSYIIGSGGLRKFSS